MAQPEQTPIGKPPCNGCRKCCKDYFVELVKGKDDPKQYLTQKVKGYGSLVLQRKKNGECIYLGKTGCTIYDRAPTVCKSFDCRAWAFYATAKERDEMREDNAPVFHRGIDLLPTMIPDGRRWHMIQRRVGNE